MRFEKFISMLLSAVLSITSLAGIGDKAARAEEMIIPAVQYDFENDALSDIDAVFTKGASLTEDSTKNSKVLYLDGTTGSYMEIPALKDENGTVLENYTVSFDVKNKTAGNYFNFYIGDGTSKATGTNYLGVKIAESMLISTVNSAAEKKTNFSGGSVQGVWTHIDITVSDGIVSVYIDGMLAGSLTGYKMSAIGAEVIRFGFSAWIADAASNAYYDDVKVYDRVLDEYELTGKSQEVRPDEKSDKLLFAMNFNNQDTTALAGKATANGAITYVQSDDTSYAARFNGNGGYLTLTNEDGSSLLAGKDEITVTFRKKADSATSWWFFAAPNNNAQTYLNEHYFGVLDTGVKLSAERYHNSGARTASAEYSYTQGMWNEVTLVIGKEKTAMYIDGRLMSEKEYEFKLSDMLGSSPVTYIGKANWGSGEWATGVIDDIAIFDFAPEIELGDLSDVKSDITLPVVSEETDGYSIEWSSTDEATISKDGKVTIPETGRKNVTLTATVKFGNHEFKRHFYASVMAEDYNDYSMEIKKEKGVLIQDGMIGLFFEDINYAADGGLYAEMIENRSFECLKSDGRGGTTLDGLYGWSTYPANLSSLSLTLKSTGGLNENNTHYVSFSGNSGTGFANQAYDGVYMEADKSYNISVFAKSDSYTGAVKARVYKDGVLAGETVLAESLTDEWTKYTAVLVPTETVRYADFVIELDSVGSADFDMISCFPSDAVEGIFRKDLAEKLKDIKPGFLRFPGGCVIEGYNLANRYNWKDSVGPVEERKQNWNRWATHRNEGLDDGYKHYNQTYGLGYYEYFILCEYLGAEALPVVNVGLACQYQSSESVAVGSDAFNQYIQDALDLIEFANGGVDTTYGKIRAEMGHPEPFGLEILGVGNEQWQTYTNNWFTRYELFEEAIHAKYPKMKLVGTSGPGVQDASYYQAWEWIREKAEENPNFVSVVDEHYYRTPEWFYQNINFYDGYDRNVKVFAGEYASRWVNQPNDPSANIWETALSEAAYMTMIERNADVVYMASYAPLFARLNYTQWSPDMIWFDDAESYGSPTYYVQKLYGNNMGDYTLKSTLTEFADTSSVFQNTSYDEKTGDIIIKIANSGAKEQNVPLSIDSEFKLTGKATIERIENELGAMNSIAQPENVSPVKSEVSDITSEYTLTLPAYSFTVMRIETEGGAIDPVSVTELDYDNEEVSFTLNNAQGIEAVFYVAEYDSEGILAGITAIEKNVQTKAENVLLEYVMKNKDNVLKLFVWDGEHTPLVDSVLVK